MPQYWVSNEGRFLLGERRRTEGGEAQPRVINPGTNPPGGPARMQTELVDSAGMRSLKIDMVWKRRLRWETSFKVCDRRATVRLKLGQVSFTYTRSQYAIAGQAGTVNTDSFEGHFSGWGDGELLPAARRHHPGAVTRPATKGEGNGGCRAKKQRV